ncbi:hypothetical protein D3C75_685610 [compost metagenome]
MLLVAVDLSELFHNLIRFHIVEINNLYILLTPAFAFLVIRIRVDLNRAALDPVGRFALFFTDDFGIREIKILGVILRTTLAGF